MKDEKQKENEQGAASGGAAKASFEKNEVSGMFEGPILPLIMKLSTPILLGMVFQLLYNVVDTFWVGLIDRQDPAYVGGVGLIFPLIFFVVALGNGLSVGISSLVARAIGEKNREVLDKTAESGLFLAGVLSAVTLVVFIGFGSRLVTALGARGDFYTHGLNYLMYLLPMGALTFFGNVFFGILQGEGLMRNVMIAMIIGTVANIILDPVFIFLLKLDVRGAAIATNIGQLLSLIYVFRFLKEGKNLVPVKWSAKNLDFSVVRKIIIIGLPQALGQMIMSVAMIIYNKMVIAIDETAMTAFSLCGRMEQLVLLPAFAQAAAVISMVGQNSGRRNFERVGKIMNAAYLLGIAAVFVLATAMIIFARPLFSIFSGNEAVIDYAVRQTRTLQYFYMFSLVGILSRSFFQAVGYPLPALFLTFLRVLLISVPAAYLYTRFLGLGVYGVWFGLATGSVISAAISFTLVKKFTRGLKENRLSIRHT